MSNSYLDLEIYKISFDLFIKAHQLSMELPKYELYELGSQLRRACDSINSNIVEGYGHRKYKNEFIRFLIFSHSSNLETINHLKKIQILYPKITSTASLLEEYVILGIKISNFITYVEKNWRS
ncbi:four helix bundle protein [Algoriphagus iocasae]|uniref:Four helix bundle protein n=1 Tax=Algoriphagus iocasae TaxID=1836499 RepID=A0A841N0U8_9BACT|nr:four helix bundle protein [Algoriphagus iocasae]MBB6327831.1 four helix bundle protein [Algoriphagus iocasae]